MDVDNKTKLKIIEDFLELAERKDLIDTHDEIVLEIFAEDLYKSIS